MANAFRELLLKYKLNQRELSDLLGVTPSAVSSCVNEKIPLPRKYLDKTAQIFKVESKRLEKFFNDHP